MAVKVPRNSNKNGLRNVTRFGLFWAIVIFVGLIIYAALFSASQLKEVALSDLVGRANKGEISKIEIEGNDIVANYEIGRASCRERV